jgi:hypothetical protein
MRAVCVPEAPSDDVCPKTDRSSDVTEAASFNGHSVAARVEPGPNDRWRVFGILLVPSSDRDPHAADSRV